MKSSGLILLIGLGLASPASAAVSGFHDSAAQIETILQDGGVADALSQAPVQAMEHTGTRKQDGALRWTLRTNRCNLFVFLTVKPAQGLGRTTYEVKEIGGCK